MTTRQGEERHYQAKQHPLRKKAEVSKDIQNTSKGRIFLTEGRSTSWNIATKRAFA